MELWIGCFAGALERRNREAHEIGWIDDIDIEPTLIYIWDAASFLAGAGLDAGMAEGIEGRFLSAFIRGTKKLPVISLRRSPLYSSPSCMLVLVVSLFPSGP